MRTVVRMDVTDGHRFEVSRVLFDLEIVGAKRAMVGRHRPDQVFPCRAFQYRPKLVDEPHTNTKL